jgi:dienelactone hydrolase
MKKLGFSPNTCYLPLARHAPRRLAFAPQADIHAWRQDADTTLRRLVGQTPDKIPLDLRVEWEQDTELFHEIRFVFRTEANADVPAHLLIPRAGSGPFPVMICLQGHTSGMHLSLGRVQYPGDEESLTGDRDYAIQAVRQGFAALAIEQRAFGERRDDRPEEYHHGVDRPCFHATLTALLLGRTLLGERVWDVSRAIDALVAFPQVDGTRIGIVGDSTGGTISYYAACLDQRITAVMPVAYVCTFRDTLAIHDHCEDHYLPGLMNEFELSDLAGLIAPRPMVVVHGRYDIAFPYSGTLEAYAEIEKIYTAFGAPQNCRLVTGEGVHRFFADLAWPVFRELTGW